MFSFLLIFVINIIWCISQIFAQKLPNRQAYENLKLNLKSIQQDCGEICNTNITGVPGKFFEGIKKETNCEALYSNPYIDEPSEFKIPPEFIPKWLKSHFTYNGKVPVNYNYMDNTKRLDEDFAWTDEKGDWKGPHKIRAELIQNGTYIGPYGVDHTQALKDLMKNYLDLPNKRVLVIGSWRPWIEMFVLKFGAKEITSIDVQKIQCTHPKITMLTNQEFNQKYLRGELPKFDLVISISSIEHSGLGR